MNVGRNPNVSGSVWLGGCQLAFHKSCTEPTITDLDLRGPWDVVVTSQENLHMVTGLASAKVNVDWALFAAIFAEWELLILSPVLTILFPVECELAGLTSFNP